MKADSQYIFGPVPSRRLGFSLGVDLVPFKTCTLDCVYCQLGSAGETTLRREVYAPPEEVLRELGEKLKEGGRIYWITLSGSGEPTLHRGIGDLIPAIKKLSPIPVAVLTNGTLLNLPEVREALAGADLVVPSLDAGTEEAFRRINRPYAALTLDSLVRGIADFTAGFGGPVWLEVMILKGFNDSEIELAAIASRIREIGPERVQLNNAVRPGAVSGLDPLDEEEMERVRLFLEKGAGAIPVEVVAGFSGRRKEVSGRDLSPAIAAYLKRRPATAEDLAAVFGIPVDRAAVHLGRLLESGTVREVDSGGKKFYSPPSTPEPSR